jgi:uncharacterized membrane protein YeiH
MIEEEQRGEEQREKQRGYRGFRPEIRQTDLYATTAIARAALYLTVENVGVSREPATYFGMAAVAGLRFAAIRWKLRLPVFHVPDDDPKSS